MADVVLSETAFSVGNSALEVQDRLLEDMPSRYDKAEGTFVFDIQATIAQELESFYLALDQAMNMAFIQTATGVYLDALGQENGLDRKVGNFANASLTFTGTTGTFIAANTRVTNEVPSGASGNPIVFQTTEDLTLSGSTGTVMAQAIEVGDDGNVSANTLTRLETGVVGITSVTNVDPATDGQDPEDDDDYRTRLLRRAKQGRGAGTPGDLQAWAEQVTGVGHAFVEPLWNGNGTARVIVVDDTFSPVGDEVLSDVENYLGSLIPIGLSLTVVTPSTANLNVQVLLVLDTSYTSQVIQPIVTTAIQKLLKDIAPGGVVYVTDVGAAIKGVPGILDYSGLVIGLGAVDDMNVQMGSNQKPVLGTLTLL